MKNNLNPLQTRIYCVVVLGTGSLFGLAAATENSADTPPATTAIPGSQLGAKVGADYPTLSDASWSTMGGMAGTDGAVLATAVDGLGSLYIGGSFNVAGDVVASHVTKWNGSSWTALGSGVNGLVYALAVSGSDLYAGGGFTTAGGHAATNIAKWDGSSWSAVGSGLGGGADYAYVSALTVSGSDLYAAGWFSTAGGISANRIAKWDGSAWTSVLASGGGSALAISGRDLYAGGGFTTAGGKVSAYIARAYLRALPTLSVLRSGENLTVSWPTVDTAGFSLEQASLLAAPAGWVINSAAFADDGAKKSVTIPATNSSQFLRLRRP